MDLLSCLLFAAQGASAEEVYRTIVDRLAKAPAFTVAFSSEATIKSGKVTFSGTLDVSGQRARLEIRHAAPFAAPRVLLVSDGKESRQFKEFWGAPFATPPKLRDILNGHLSRTGLAHAYITTAGELGWTHGRFESTFDFRISDVRKGENDGKAYTLMYRVRSVDRKTGQDVETFGSVGSTEAPGSAAAVTLWYDPATHVPLKRTARCAGQEGREAVFTETYDKFVLGAEIPDERFHLPKK
jgi:hypothetical protein